MMQTGYVDGGRARWRGVARQSARPHTVTHSARQPACCLHQAINSALPSRSSEETSRPPACHRLSILGTGNTSHSAGRPQRRGGVHAGGGSKNVGVTRSPAKRHSQRQRCRVVRDSSQGRHGEAGRHGDGVEAREQTVRRRYPIRHPCSLSSRERPTQRRTPSAQYDIALPLGSLARSRTAHGAAHSACGQPTNDDPLPPPPLSGCVYHPS